MKKLLLAVFVFTALFTAQAQPVYACSCVLPGTPAEEMEKSDAVFSGTVSSIEASGDYGYEVTFQVDQVWKGVQDSLIKVQTGRGGGDCGFNFKKGEEYLVYASLTNGELHVYTCSLTGILAKSDVKGLGKATTILEDTSSSNPGQVPIVFFVGLLSSIVLVLGSLWPERRLKNWIFGLGNFGMLAYAILAFYLEGKPLFFVLLEILCAGSSVLALLNVKEKISTRLIGAAGLALLIWAGFLFEDAVTFVFIFGLIALALGFISKDNVKRNLVFLLGCILISTFSFLKGEMIFFWLNAIFGISSGFYLLKALKKR